MYSPVKTLLAIATLCLACGCATFRPEVALADRTVQAQLGPRTAPARSITGFTDSLRCVDEMMLFHGVRDVTMMVEDLADNTKKLSAGTRDMLISAVSEATKRSRGVKLITFGQDVGNLAAFMNNAQTNAAFANMPMFNIRGSVSQFDDNVMRKQIDGGMALGGLSAGAARSASFAVLGIDLNVISTDDFSLVPGVTARNQVAVFKTGSGADGEAEYKKFGINFSQTLQRAEGQSQALRTLVELGVVELFGRLFRMPYWKCLGVSPEHDAVRQEVADWFLMLGDGDQMTPWMQIQLAQRGFYQGPIDGKPNAQLRQAVVQARSSLGMSATAQIDVDFFDRFLDQFQRRMDVMPRLLDRSPLTVSVSTPGQGPVYQHGQRLALRIQTNRDAHLYCYMQDATRRWMRILPNAYSGGALKPAANAVSLPAGMPFELVAESGAGRETVACFATATDVVPQLPRAIMAPAFQYLTIRQLSELDDAFKRATGGVYGKGLLEIRFES
jgi:peptidoglycan hydrolase-like protein with peptidoglycan-binding domain